MGIIAGVMLLVGGAIYFVQPDADPFMLGMLTRTGALLAVICLAFPELMAMRGKVSIYLYGIAIILVMIIAVRPSMSRMLVALAAIGFGVMWVMKLMRKITEQDPRNR